MTQYAKVQVDAARIVCGVGRPDPVDFDGAPDLRPLPHDGFVYYAWQCPLDFGVAPTPTSIYKWSEQGPVWIDDADLADRRAHKVAEMSQCCADAILAGFVSTALGAAYSYPAKPNDQLNLIGSVAASFYPNVGVDWLTPFWCMDAGGAWAFRLHTAAQIQQVGVDGKNAILNCMTINEQLRAQIATADDDRLATIVWPA